METIFNHLNESGVFEYGESINRVELLGFFGMKCLDAESAKNMTFDEVKQCIQDDALTELNITDYIRNQLIDQGKYFYKNGVFYCVALPSQNIDKANAYMRSAQRKIKRARRLLASTPASTDTDKSQNSSRLMLAEMTTERHKLRNPT